MSPQQSSLLDHLDEYLDTYNGRDKFLKAICYSLKFATGFTESPKNVDKLKLLSSEISNCRTILRMLDYIPVLNYSLSYQFGKKEGDRYLRLIGMITSIVDPIFYPMEQIAWAAERNIINVNPDPWSDASTVCWVISLYLNLMKALRSMSLLEQHKKCLQKVDVDMGYAILQLTTFNILVDAKISRIAMNRIAIQQQGLLLMTLRTCCDLTYAVHYLPEGFLWSGKLKTWQVGVLGMVSASLGIFQSLSSRLKVPVS